MNTTVAPISNLRLSVVQAGAVVDASQRSSATANKSQYRQMVDSRRTPGTDANGFGLPWRGPKNNYWQYRVGPEYMNTPSPALVGGLMPMRRDLGKVVVGAGVEFHAEAFWLPFAVACAVHSPEYTADPRQSFDAQALAVDTLLQSNFADTTSKVKGGLPAGRWTAKLPAGAELVGGSTVALRQPVRVISALLDEGSSVTAEAMAAALAGAFQSGDGPVGTRLTTDGAAVAFAGGNVGIVFTKGLPRADKRLECFHMNVVTALGQAESLAGLVFRPTGPDLADEWYHDRAAALLRSWFAREPEDLSLTTYKSRVLSEWIKKSGIASKLGL